MRALEITAWGEPKGQPRARSTVRRGKGGKVFSGVYDPGTADDWKSIVRAAAMEKWDRVPFSGPTAVTVLVFFRRPKSHLASNGLPKASAPVWHTSKPDRDNIDKAILDALVSCGVLSDDKIVCGGRGVLKRWSIGAPYAQITISDAMD